MNAVAATRVGASKLGRVDARVDRTLASRIELPYTLDLAPLLHDEQAAVYHVYAVVVHCNQVPGAYMNLNEGHWVVLLRVKGKWSAPLRGGPLERPSCWGVVCKGLRG